MSGANNNNAKGMFENFQIRNDVVKRYYASIGADILGQHPLPDIKEIPIPIGWQGKIEDIIQDDGYEEGPWMYKGAKMCQHWPVWNYAFPEAKWVIVRRKTPDIINSCIRTGFMRAFMHRNIQRAVGAESEYEGWYWWVEQHLARFKEMIDDGLDTTVVWPERMVDGDYGQVKEMIEGLGLEWKEDEVITFIEPKLWKARKNK